MIAAIGEKREAGIGSLESGPGVAEVVPILAPYKVASREVKPEPTVAVRQPDGGQRHDRRHRRAVLGRERRADPGLRPAP